MIIELRYELETLNSVVTGSNKDCNMIKPSLYTIMYSVDCQWHLGKYIPFYHFVLKFSKMINRYIFPKTSFDSPYWTYVVIGFRQKNAADTGQKSSGRCVTIRLVDNFMGPTMCVALFIKKLFAKAVETRPGQSGRQAPRAGRQAGDPNSGKLRDVPRHYWWDTFIVVDNH